MKQKTTEYDDFNAIELETQIEDDSINKDSEYHTGYFDGLTEGKPNPDDWSKLNYQNGYLEGVKAHYNSMFAEF